MSVCVSVYLSVCMSVLTILIFKEKGFHGFARKWRWKNGGIRRKKRRNGTRNILTMKSSKTTITITKEFAL